MDSFLAEAALENPAGLSEMNRLFNVWLSECYHNKEHASLGISPGEAYKASRTPLRFPDENAVVKAFLKVEKRKVDKSGCISFSGRKYEVGVIYIGRTVDIVYDLADTNVLTVEDKHFGTAFQIRELVISEHTGPRAKLPQSLAAVPPSSSRLLDGKLKHYENRQLSAKRAISYAQINKEGGDGNV